jgi:hypothetical protein
LTSFLLSVCFGDLAIGYRAILDNAGRSHPKILNLMTSAKTLSPKKATFSGSRDLRWTSLRPHLARYGHHHRIFHDAINLSKGLTPRECCGKHV